MTIDGVSCANLQLLLQQQQSVKDLGMDEMTVHSYQ